MKHVCYTVVIGLIATFSAARSASAATLTPILGPGGFLSPTTITNDFETGAPETAPANTPQFTFEGTALLGTASSWTANTTSSGVQGLVESIANEPMRIVFTTPVNEVGMFFGNDDFNLVFNANLELFDAGNASLGSVQVLSNANDFADQYIGVRSDTAAKSAAIYYDRPAAQQVSVYIDDLKVGLVPEPSGVALAVWGVLGLAASAGILRTGRYGRRG